jgi:hypothetical protein
MNFEKGKKTSLKNELEPFFVGLKRGQICIFKPSDVERVHFGNLNNK